MGLTRQLGFAVLGVMLALPALAAEPSTGPAGPHIIYIANLRNGFSISHERSEVRDGGITRLYTSGDGYVDVPTANIASIESEELLRLQSAQPAAKLKPDVPLLVSGAGAKHRLDEDFIKSVIRAESGFNPRARSPKGAQGLMQLMPGTAQKLGVQDAFEPGANIDAGARYLRQLLEQYHGDVAKALAAYNAGPERVSQYRGVPPYSETRAYVKKVITDYNRAKRSEQKKTPAAAPAKKEPAEAAEK